MRSPLTALLASLLILAAGALALAQSSRILPPKPKPFLTRHPIDKRDWTIITEVRLYGFKTVLQPNDNQVFPLLTTQPIILDSLSAVFPLLRSSSMHDVHQDAARGHLKLAKRVVDAEPRIVRDYQGPTDLLIWDARDIDSKAITLRVEIPITSYNTRIDEDAAFQVPWTPKDHEWPPHIAANLKGQLFVEPNHPAIQALAREWTNGKPRKASPYYLAKYLAGKVVEYYTPDGRIFEATARGATPIDVGAILMSGFRVDGSVAAAEFATGSPLDAANLLTAVYRAVGIPARVVIAYDILRSTQYSSLRVRAWSEFYLYDPRSDFGQWIPVDISRQREFSSRMPPIDQRWQFFGHNEQFQFTAPLAFHWHPPTSVTNAGPPALWGWLPKPGNPYADQHVSFIVMGTPKRGDGKPANQVR